MSNKTQLQASNEKYASLIEALRGKAVGGVELPELDNPASASDILGGKEAIDENGEVITGTIATKTSSDLTSSGATVTVPAGYYASQEMKSVSRGSARTPATTVTKNPTISVSASGLISASVSGTQNVTPAVTAGYVSSGTSGTITVSGSTTKQLTTQAAKTVTPTTSSQTAVASGVYTTGAVTVGPIPSNYEDVGTETTEYTSLASQLEAVINSLPEAGTGGGGNGWIDLSSLPTPYTLAPPFPVYLYEKPANCIALIFYEDGSGQLNMCTNFESWSAGFVTIGSSEDNVLSIGITSQAPHYMFPIYTP